MNLRTFLVWAAKWNGWNKWEHCVSIVSLHIRKFHNLNSIMPSSDSKKKGLIFAINLIPFLWYMSSALNLNLETMWLLTLICFYRYRYAFHTFALTSHNHLDICVPFSHRRRETENNWMCEVNGCYSVDNLKSFY